MFHQYLVTSFYDLRHLFSPTPTVNTPEGSYCAERVLFLCAAEEAIREAVVWGLCVSREISPAMEGMMNVSCPPEQFYKELNAICF